MCYQRVFEWALSYCHYANHENLLLSDQFLLAKESQSLIVKVPLRQSPTLDLGYGKSSASILYLT